MGASSHQADQPNKRSTNQPLHHFNGTLVGENDINTVNLIMDSPANNDDEVQDLLDGYHLNTITDPPHRLY